VTAAPTPIAPELLAILVDPVDRQPLLADGDRLVNTARGMAYPVIDGIPVLLSRAAVELTDPPVPTPGAGDPSSG
jgi:uncharacterized protein YbaR (Trm112 family)